jgi:flagellar basal body P-ring formation protein FlgA
MQSLAAVSEAARTFADANGLRTGERRTIDVGPLDARLRLDDCPVALAASAAPGVRSSLRMTVEVRCPIEGGWRLFVPVRIQAYDKAVVALRALPRGHVLSAADLSVVVSDVSALPPGYAREASALIGRRTSRPVTAGAVLGGGIMVLEPTVRRGQAVTLVAQARGLSIRAQGVAVTAGGVDERIRIKNLSSGREIEGIVRSAALVEIPLP